jgi:hypothetical protein
MLNDTLACVLSVNKIGFLERKRYYRNIEWVEINPAKRRRQYDLKAKKGIEKDNKNEEEGEEEEGEKKKEQECRRRW